MKKIICSECGKTLFTTHKSGGVVGAEAQRLGFIVKMPILYGVEGIFFFCDKEHCDSWFSKNVPKDKEMDKLLSEARKKIPEMAKDLCKRMDALQKALKEISKK